MSPALGTVLRWRREAGPPEAVVEDVKETSPRPENTSQYKIDCINTPLIMAI